MYSVLIGLIIGFFTALLFLNIYFRFKVLKYYKILRNNKVEFPTKYILNSASLKKDVLPRYPKYASEIQAFCNHIQFSVKVASALLFLITLLAAIIFYYEK